MVTISSEPMFTGPSKRERISRIVPSMHSDTYRKDLVCLPSPQISIARPFGVIAILRHSAAGAFSRPPSQVPSGPKIL